MVLEQDPDRKEEDQQLIPSDSLEITPAEIEEPTPPRGLSEEECDEIRKRTEVLVSELAESAGSREMELLDSATHVGVQAQRNSATKLDLLRVRVGTMLNEEGTSNEIANGMRDLRVTLNEINPQQMTNPGLWYRFFGVLPFFSAKYNPVARALYKVALRYEPVSRQVTAIETKLREGRALLVRDNVELRKLYEQVEAEQSLIQKNAYLGELLMQQLAELLERTDEPMKRERIQSALHDVAMRVQDMRTMEQVHIQYFVSIEMTRQNNNRLGQSVERTLTLATSVVTVGLAIQAALMRQKKVMEATRRTREFLGDMIVANAVAIRQHTEEIGDLYNNPVIAMDKITQAHNELMEAMDTADRLKQEGIDAARQNIVKLNQLSTDMHQRASSLLDQGQEEPKSIEA